MVELLLLDDRVVGSELPPPGKVKVPVGSRVVLEVLWVGPRVVLEVLLVLVGLELNVDLDVLVVLRVLPVGRRVVVLVDLVGPIEVESQGPVPRQEV